MKNENQNKKKEFWGFICDGFTETECLNEIRTSKNVAKQNDYCYEKRKSY